MSNFFGQTAFGSLTDMGASIGTGLLNQMFAKRNFDREMKAQKELMREQEASQLRMLTQGPAAQKAGLQAAGISTAGMNGQFSQIQGASPAGPAMAAPNFPASSLSSAFSNMASGISTTLDNKVKDEMNKETLRKLMADADYATFQADLFKKTIPLEIETRMQSLSNLRATGKLTNQQFINARKQLELIGENVRNMRINNKYLDQLKSTEVQKLKNEVFILAQKGRVEELTKKLAEKGIYLNAGFLPSLMAINQQPGAFKNLIDSLVSSIKTAAGSSDTIFGTIIGALLDGATSAYGAGVNLFDKVRDLPGIKQFVEWWKKSGEQGTYLPK